MNALGTELARERGGDARRSSRQREQEVRLAARRRQERRIASAQRRVNALRAALT